MLSSHDASMLYHSRRNCSCGTPFDGEACKSQDLAASAVPAELKTTRPQPWSPTAVQQAEDNEAHQHNARARAQGNSSTHKTFSLAPSVHASRYWVTPEFSRIAASLWAPCAPKISQIVLTLLRYAHTICWSAAPSTSHEGTSQKGSM